jgi:hypothetical protein
MAPDAIAWRGEGQRLRVWTGHPDCRIGEYGVWSRDVQPLQDRCGTKLLFSLSLDPWIGS